MSRKSAKTESLLTSSSRTYFRAPSGRSLSRSPTNDFAKLPTRSPSVRKCTHCSAFGNSNIHRGRFSSLHQARVDFLGWLTRPSVCCCGELEHKVPGAHREMSVCCVGTYTEKVEDIGMSGRRTTVCGQCGSTADVVDFSTGCSLLCIPISSKSQKAVVCSRCGERETITNLQALRL